MIYRDGNKMLYVTNQHPKGLKGVVSICLTGTDPTNVTEEAIPTDSLKKLLVVEEISPEWRAAFGLKEPTKDLGVAKRCSPRRQVRKASKPRSEPMDEFEDDWHEAAYRGLREMWLTPLIVIMFPIVIPMTVLLIVMLLGDFIWSKTCPPSSKLSTLLDQPIRSSGWCSWLSSFLRSEK